MADYQNLCPNSRGIYINASIWVLQALATVFLGLRVYCKMLRHRGLWYDDYFLIAAWALLAVSAASTTANVALGFGRHFADFNPANLERYAIISLLSGFFSILSAVCSKTSFAITLLRLTEGRMRHLIWGIIVSMNLLMPLSALFLFVACDPPAKTWKPYLPGKCWPEKVSVIYGIVVGGKLFLRVPPRPLCALCATPASLTNSLLVELRSGPRPAALAHPHALPHVPPREDRRGRCHEHGCFVRRLALAPLAFANPALQCLCHRHCQVRHASAARQPRLYLCVPPSSSFEAPCFRDALSPSPDDGAPFIVWGFAECAVSIMAASIPALRVLFQEIRGAPPLIQRMIPSLRLSPAASGGAAAAASDAKRPSENDSKAMTTTTTTTTTTVTRPDNDDHIPGAASPPPPHGQPSSSSSGPPPNPFVSADDRSDRSILKRAGVSGVANVHVVREMRSDAGEVLGEHDIEMGKKRHSYQLQGVQGA